MSRSALAFINNLESHELSGPDFLIAVADAEESLGNVINAAEYRRRAKQWQADLDAAGAAPTPAANDSAWPAHLPRLVRASELPGYHITPSDHR